MIVEVLSDHPGEQRASRRWWQLLRRVRDRAALRALDRRAPGLERDLEGHRAQQTAGIRGEEAMTAALSVLSDEWVLFRGYANRRGEVDHLLVGPGGVWAIEVKARAARVHVDGDHWWFEKFDRYGNRVEQGVLADRRGRSWGRQVTEIAGELAAFLASRGQHVGVRSAVVVLHDRGELGSCRALGVDLLCVGSGHLLHNVSAERRQLERSDRDAVAGLVRRDHAFHAKRRRGGGRGRRRRR